MYTETMVKNSGLCVTCNNGSFCVFRKKRGFDAIYCDTFDISSLNGKGRVAVIFDEIKSSVKKTNGEVLGLCSNCENYDNCTLPKPDGGVWHCEEYR